MLIIGLAHALVVFRVVAAPLMYRGKWTFIKDHARTAAVTLGAVLHYFTIQIMTRVRVSLSPHILHVFLFISFICILVLVHISKLYSGFWFIKAWLIIDGIFYVPSLRAQDLD